MPKQKMNQVGTIVSVRVGDEELEMLRQIMKVTQLNASSVLREAIKLYVAPGSGAVASHCLPQSEGLP